MPSIDDLRKKIESKKADIKAPGKDELAEPETVDLEQVEKIVSKMKKKYREQGVEFEEVGGRLSELRGIIAEGEAAKINVQPVEELKEFRSPIIRQLGNFYLSFQFLFKPLTRNLRRFPIAKELAYYLYSANMKFSAQQYLALSVASAAIGLIFGMVIGAIVSFLWAWPIWSALLIGILFFFITLILVMIIPKTIAQRRGDEMSVELPFALRHMATELKAGIGLYKALQAIAQSDYGVLSDEFSRTINEIEEGTDTKDALRHFALRTQSRALRSALFHVIRALKTGGNLSNVMGEIAEDVSFELRMKIRDFAEKMNFFGVIFIFGAIVLPVFVAIIGAVTNAPLGVNFSQAFQLTPQFIIIFYALIMPLVIALLLVYLKFVQPRV